MMNSTIENIRGLKERILKITTLVLDVDGVFTDGSIIHGNSGNELKIFNVQDGMGITLAREGGLKTSIITGRTSEAVTKRAEELKIDTVFQGAADKMTAWEKLLAGQKITPEQICYMGDDLLDLCLLNRAGLAVCPANARPEIKNVVHVVTRATGGCGAVRELVEIILKTQNKWEDLIEKYNY